MTLIEKARQGRLAALVYRAHAAETPAFSGIRRSMAGAGGADHVQPRVGGTTGFHRPHLTLLSFA